MPRPPIYCQRCKANGVKTRLPIDRKWPEPFCSVCKAKAVPNVVHDETTAKMGVLEAPRLPLLPTFVGPELIVPVRTMMELRLSAGRELDKEEVLDALKRATPTMRVLLNCDIAIQVTK